MAAFARFVWRRRVRHRDGLWSGWWEGACNRLVLLTPSRKRGLRWFPRESKQRCPVVLLGVREKLRHERLPTTFSNSWMTWALPTYTLIIVICRTREICYELPACGRILLIFCPGPFGHRLQLSFIGAVVRPAAVWFFIATTIVETNSSTGFSHWCYTVLIKCMSNSKPKRSSVNDHNTAQGCTLARAIDYKTYSTKVGGKPLRTLRIKNSAFGKDEATFVSFRAC